MNNNYGFTKDTKVLTIKGWCPISDVNINTKVLSYSIEDAILQQDQVLATNKTQACEIYKTFHKQCSFTHGKDQLWWGWKRLWAKKGLPREKLYHKFKIKDATQEFNIICSAPYKNFNSKVTEDEAAFIGWLLSDGHYKWSKNTKRTSSSFGKKQGITGMIAQAQHKFYKEVGDVIAKVNLDYTLHLDNTGIKTSPVNKYHFKSKQLRAFMDNVVGIRAAKTEINWCEQILSYGDKEIYQYLYNFWLADGDTLNKVFGKKQTTITQNYNTVSDSVLLAMYLQGRRVSISNKDAVGKCGTLRMLNNSHLTLQETTSDFKELVDTYDVLTRNGTYIIKQGAHISITCSSSFS